MDDPVVIIGAGIGGLAAALDLAARGIPVEVIEKEQEPGGKMRRLSPRGRPIDAGPTVFTLRGVFDELFDAAGASLDAELRPTRLHVLARHAWDGADAGPLHRLDLLADRRESADAIGRFAGKAEAEGFLSFSAEAGRIFQTLHQSFMLAQRPSLAGLTRNVGYANMGALLATRPFVTLWGALGGHFRDPRLRQLFGRYATYCGSSPFEAPGTLMLVAHAEQEGVWSLDGGMHALAEAMRRLAELKGARFRFGASVERIDVDASRASGVRLSTGERVGARAVVFNGDVSALGSMLRGKAAAPPTSRPRRSLSAVTWCLDARADGFPLTRHNVFFSRDYRAEFDAIGRARALPNEPTVYVCAQDRADDVAEGATSARDRLLCLVNAPPDGDGEGIGEREIAACGERAFALLARCGLSIDRADGGEIVTAPNDFERLFPASGGALYGPASHGWTASFRRAGSRTRLPGLYLAGGSVHPAPGVPMAAISGRLAAAALMEDRR